MISMKELEYVDQYARNVPFPGKEYAREAMSMLLNAYKTYNENYRNKSYSFIFSNGEEINFRIFEKNLAHLFGIDYRNLTSEYMKYSVYNVLKYEAGVSGGADELLRRIVKKVDDVIENDSHPSNFHILNYYRVLIKCTAFTKLTKFENFNFGCINFDQEVHRSMYENPLGSSSKYFFVPSNEPVAPYSAMGILPNNETSLYVPETIRVESNFAHMVHNQTFIVPIQILINDNYKLTKLVATPEEKIKTLELYKSIISSYETNTFVDIYRDYEGVLRELNELKLRKK